MSLTERQRTELRARINEALRPFGYTMRDADWVENRAWLEVTVAPPPESGLVGMKTQVRNSFDSFESVAFLVVAGIRDWVQRQMAPPAAQEVPDAPGG